MYTHGMGLVMSPANQINREGGPNYALQDVPPKAAYPIFEAEPRIYFGEGTKDDYILTNIRYLKEFDHATKQFRKENVYPAEVKSGIPVDSFFKRVVFAFHTMDITAFLFSRFIDYDRTRIHVFRTPMQRISIRIPMARCSFLSIVSPSAPMTEISYHIDAPKGTLINGRELGA